MCMVLLSQKCKGCYCGSIMIEVNSHLFYHGSSCLFWQLLLLLCHDYCTILWCPTLSVSRFAFPIFSSLFTRWYYVSTSSCTLWLKASLVVSIPELLLVFFVWCWSLDRQTPTWAWSIWLWLVEDILDVRRNAWRTGASTIRIRIN